jgi:hypothetical protein
VGGEVLAPYAIGRLATKILIIFAFVPAISIAQADEMQVYDAEIAAPGVFNLIWHNYFTPRAPTAPQ